MTKLTELAEEIERGNLLILAAHPFQSFPGAKDAILAALRQSEQAKTLEAQICCQDYAHCSRACTPKGIWPNAESCRLAEQRAEQAEERCRELERRLGETNDH